MSHPTTVDVDLIKIAQLMKEISWLQEKIKAEFDRAIIEKVSAQLFEGGGGI